jgi:hypothetical protein
MKKLSVRLAVGAALSFGLSQAGVGTAADALPAHHIRGTLTSVSKTELTVSTSSGPVTVRIDPSTKVVGVVPATVAEITSGAFIGTVNVPGATSTSTRALEVVVFPESMAGLGEGDSSWDLPAGNGHSSMTNGTLAPKHAGSMMTNATVMGVNNGVSKTVTLQYKGGFKNVTIPPGTPILRAVPGSPRLLVPGAHVLTQRGKRGAAAPFLIVGEQGTVLPM